MLDPLFSFIDPIIEPIIEFSENNACFVIRAETFFNFREKSGTDKTAGIPEGAKIAVPLDIVLSLLKPDELEKLRKYITSYLAMQNSSKA
jgi:hypothetical protein